MNVTLTHPETHHPPPVFPPKLMMYIVVLSLYNTGSSLRSKLRVLFVLLVAQLASVKIRLSVATELINDNKFFLYFLSLYLYNTPNDNNFDTINFEEVVPFCHCEDKG